MGDFVKGPLKGQYDGRISNAIRLHRHIDTFTDAHPITARSRARMSASRRRVAGIIVDIGYDHFLAHRWSEYADVELADFTAKVYLALSTHEQILPQRLRSIAARMAAQDWLSSYASLQHVARALNGVASRLSRPALLSGSITEIEQNYDDLGRDFEVFFPRLVDFARRQRG